MEDNVRRGQWGRKAARTAFTDQQLVAALAADYHNDPELAAEEMDVETLGILLQQAKPKVANAIVAKAGRVFGVVFFNLLCIIIVLLLLLVIGWLWRLFP